MTIVTSVPILAVILSAVAAMVIGFVWYSKPLFGKAWAKEAGISLKQMNSGPNSGYALTLIGGLISAFVIYQFITLTGANTAWEGAQVGFWAWLGFFAPALGADFIFTKKSMNYYLITVGYHLLNFVVSGAIIAQMS